MSNRNPQPTTNAAWSQGKTRKGAKRLKEGLVRNYQAFEGKQALLATWEQVNPNDKYVTELKHRVHMKRTQLKNRGMMVDT